MGAVLPRGKPRGSTKTHNLGKRSVPPPLHPSSLWRIDGIEPSCASATDGRCIASQGFRAPTTTNPARVGCTPTSSRLDCDQGSATSTDPIDYRSFRVKRAPSFGLMS